MHSIVSTNPWFSVCAAAIALLVGCTPPPSTPAAAPAGQPAAQPAAATATQPSGNAAAAAPTAAPARPAVPEPPIQRPLEIARPPVPQFTSEWGDTAKLDHEQLKARARVSANQAQPRLAADLFRMAIEKGADQLYEMACYEARAQNLDRAFYWLQEAALQEGIDPAKCDHDTALEKLRADPRWMSVRKFLALCQDHWAKGGIDDHRLVLPANYRGTPVPVLIWLQGNGGCSSTHTYLFPEFQQLADQYQVAFLSVSGPLITGPRHFAWSTDMQVSESRIASALAKFVDKLKVKDDRVSLAGLYEGGQIVGELAAAQPERYYGALIIFPGGLKMFPAYVEATEAHRRQHMVVVTGGDKLSADLGRRFLEKFNYLGSNASSKPFTNVRSFSIFPDLKLHLRWWTAEVLGVPPG